MATLIEHVNNPQLAGGFFPSWLHEMEGLLLHP